MCVDIGLLDERLSSQKSRLRLVVVIREKGTTFQKKKTQKSFTLHLSLCGKIILRDERVNDMPDSITVEREKKNQTDA